MSGTKSGPNSSWYTLLIWLSALLSSLDNNSKAVRVGITGLISGGFVAYACQSSYVRIERSGNGENSDFARYETLAVDLADIDSSCIVGSGSGARILEIKFVVVLHRLIDGTDRNNVIAGANLRFLFHENGSLPLNRAI